MRNLRTFSVCFILAATAFLPTGCYRSDLQTFDISVPDMRDQSSARTVSNAVAKLRGVVEIDLDLENRNVAVTYNSLVTAQKNIETAIAESGFDANSVMAIDESKAKPVQKIYTKE